MSQVKQTIEKVVRLNPEPYFIRLGFKEKSINLGIIISMNGLIPVVDGTAIYWQWDTNVRVLWGDNTPIRIN